MKLDMDTQLQFWRAHLNAECQVWQAVQMGDRVDYRHSHINLWAKGRGKIVSSHIDFLGECIRVTVMFSVVRGHQTHECHTYDAAQVEVLDAT